MPDPLRHRGVVPDPLVVPPPELIAPGSFHGAKFYRHLSGDDVSQAFIDAVAVHFADVAAARTRLRLVLGLVVSMEREILNFTLKDTKGKVFLVPTAGLAYV